MGKLIFCKFLDHEGNPRGRDYTYLTDTEVQVGDFVEVEVMGNSSTDPEPKKKKVVVTKTELNPEDIPGYELKKFLQIGSEFKVLKHQKPKLVGQLRKVTKVQTNAVYTIIPNEPEHENSKCNGGKGLRMDFDKANHYEFGDTIKWFNKPVGTKDNHLIMEFEVL